MSKFVSNYTGHSRNARKALIDMALVDEKELAFLSDAEIDRKINESGYLILKDGENYALIPKQYESTITWICR